MEQNPRPDGKPGYIQVVVQPSKEHVPGVHMSVNDHYNVAEFGGQIGSEALLTILKGEFDASIERSRWIMQQVLGKPA